MAAKKTDISQIKDYLNGELDARAMHQLERRAQDDPFLMDALDGYENAGMPMQSTFDDLNNKLQQRIDKGKRGRVIQWRYFAVAASLFIIFSIAYLLWPNQQSALQKQQLTAVQIQPLAVKNEAPKTPDTLTKPGVRKQLMASVKRPNLEAAPGGETASPATDVTQNFATKTAIAPERARIDASAGNTYTNAVTKKAELPTENNITTDKALKKDSVTLKEVSVTGLAKLTAKDIEANSGAEHQTLQGKVNGVDITTPQKISGTILNELGLALPGVNVKLQGTDVVTLTDEKGRFSLPANGQATLDIEQSGFTSKRITARADDSVKIELQPSRGQALSEVVVTKSIKSAHPQMGNQAYDKYLRNLAISSDGTVGTVRLSFTVGGEGVLSNFKIIKGLSGVTNQQAINLVKNGPAWVPDASRKTKTIELKIKFRKKP